MAVSMDSFKPNILILGGNGLLGTCLSRDLSAVAVVKQLTRLDCDITDKGSLSAAIIGHTPDLILNCAGFLNADRCEKEPAHSYAINAAAVATIVGAISEVKGQKPHLVHFSTDFVFDGNKGQYSEEDLPRPLSFYGVHKYAADEIIQAYGLEKYWVLRVASVIGFNEQRPNFLKTIFKASGTRPYLEIVDDLSISTVTTELLSRYIMQMWSAKAPTGLYHATASGTTSWYSLAKKAFDTLGVEYDIRPIASVANNLAAPRPKKSSLLNSKILSHGGQARSWEDEISDHTLRYKSQYLALRAA